MGKNFIPFILTLALVAASIGKRGRAWAVSLDDGDDMPQRQEAMAEAVRAMSSYDPAQGGDEAVQRAMGVVNRAIGLLRPIFQAIGKMPEKSAADVRAKEEARAAANDLLTRHFGQLLPGGSAKIVEEF
ncbi:hypothetical protein ACQ4PT_050503 [Festuca glaucescens]